MTRNSRLLEEKYKLPGFPYGVDGVLINFDYKPVGIPPNRTGQAYVSRKWRYTHEHLGCWDQFVLSTSS